MKTAIVTSVLATLAAGFNFHKRNPVSYEGYQVLRVKTLSQLATVQEKLATIPHEQWNHDVETHIDVVISPDQIESIESLGLDYRVLHKDLGESISAESQARSTYKRDINDLSWYDSYHPYADHVRYFTDLHEAFPENSELVYSGRSFENRSIHGIHLFGDEGPGKPAVLYQTSLERRSPVNVYQVVEYITLQLINAHKNATNATDSILNQYDFHIFPVVNPDAYDTKASFTPRRLTASGAKLTCYGTDINRNWEYGWDANALGASTNSCAQAYRGQKPSDTIENQGLDAYVRKLRDTSGIKLYIDWHSYGQYILSPFGSKETWYAPELGKWTKTASVLSEVIRDSSERRTTFTFGPSGATLYTTTGAAPDHVYAIGGADFSYTIELPDTGDYGFVLPPNRILGAAEEQWEGQQVLYTLLDEVFFDGIGPA
ncbi:metallocarboxypeptidase A-like protein MCYG_01475 [Colletotrichum liriopes]|uniref:Metallocarboxypeptidase A-like protein MCYG_01475 n=1 Tax=Colletotrichum liriopes TaxID=708192 RepID=A0AA37GRI9_9PEZI|nr:metallocarboxypeptidase A-like protein MCYG_01475 [Colletotrichum liriopes]